MINCLEFEDLHDVVLVGRSYGGMVVASVTDRVPKRIGHAVYLDAEAPTTASWTSFSRRAGDVRGVRQDEG